MQSGVTEPLAGTVTLLATKKDKGQPEGTFTEDWNTHKLQKVCKFTLLFFNQPPEYAKFLWLTWLDGPTTFIVQV